MAAANCHRTYKDTLSAGCALPPGPGCDQAIGCSAWTWSRIPARTTAAALGPDMTPAPCATVKLPPPGASGPANKIESAGMRVCF